MSFMITKKSSGPVTNCSQTFKGSERSGFYDERGTRSIKETCAPKSIKSICASPLTILPTEASLYTQKKEPFLQMRRNGRSFTRIHQIEDIWQLQSPRWLHKCCVLMTKMKDNLMVQGVEIQSGQCCRKRLHKMKHEILTMDIVQMLIHESSNKMRIEYWTLWWYSNKSKN